jgi:hypothetical protein
MPIKNAVIFLLVLFGVNLSTVFGIVAAKQAFADANWRPVTKQ